MPSWVYEPDEKPKRKHFWDKPLPGFILIQGNLVGKCPDTLSLEDAQRLLNEGIPYSPKGWRQAYPKRIYVVHENCVYRATPTNPGVSYHGFPEKPSELRKLPRGLSRKLCNVLNN